MCSPAESIMEIHCSAVVPVSQIQVEIIMLLWLIMLCYQIYQAMELSLWDQIPFIPILQGIRILPSDIMHFHPISLVPGILQLVPLRCSLILPEKITQQLVPDRFGIISPDITIHP